MEDYSLETIEGHERAFARLAGEVGALRQLVEAMLLQLPDVAMEIGVDSLKSHAREAARQAREKDTDRWRDYAAAVYDTWAKIDEAATMRMAERAQGASLTTIQAAPIDPEELRLRAFGREMGKLR